MRKITSDLLRERGALQNQIDLFIAASGDKLEFTEALCFDLANRFDFHWAAMRLLIPSVRERYLDVEAAALAEYQRLVAPIWLEYWDGHIEWKEFVRITLPQQTQYERARASAFFHAWISSQNQAARL